MHGLRTGESLQRLCMVLLSLTGDLEGDEGFFDEYRPPVKFEMRFGDEGVFDEYRPMVEFEMRSLQGCPHQ